MMIKKKKAHSPPQPLDHLKVESSQEFSIENYPKENPVLPNLEPNSKPSWKLVVITISLCLGTFLVALDTVIIGTAIPSITTQFHSLEDIAWYGSAYLLTTTAFQPTFGKLYKSFPIKTVYLVCIAVFEVGSILCAAAPNSRVFIAGRTIAGCGAAGITQGALGIIANTVTLDKRPLYMGIVVSVYGISVCIGPVLGGAFTQQLSWRWCFWINVPIGGTTFILILAFLHLKQTEEQRQYRSMGKHEALKHMDPLGAALLVSSICCLFLALQWGGQSTPWNAPKIIGLLVSFGILFAGFCFVQWYNGDYATVPLRVLKQRSILSGSLYLFFFAMPNYIYPYYLPIYFQSIKGSTAIHSGVQFMAIALSQIFFIVLSGAATSQWGYYVPYMIGGTALSVVGSGLLTTLGVDTSTALWASFSVICGVGIGLGINVPYTAVQVVLSTEDAPIGNAISQFMFQLGAAISLSIGQTIFLNKLITTIPQKTPHISPSAVLAAGAYGLPKIAESPQVLRLLREAYSSALHGTFIFALAAGCVGCVCACGMENKNVKAIAKARANTGDEGEVETQSSTVA